MKRIFLMLSLLAAAVAPAQTLSFDEYMKLVKTYHPLAKQAALEVEIARAAITAARGAFDPVFQNEIARKEFDGLLYYDHQVTEIKIPTWYGVDVVTGIESLSGNRTSTPDTKGASSYVGFSVPVAKGLLLDRRRADLQQAKIFRDLSVQEQRAALNNLLYDAAKAYWTWWQQQQTKSLFEQAIKNAEQRFRFVKTAYALGDRPAIDTVEALAQLQSFQQRQTEVLLDVANSGLEAGVFLWRENGEAYTLPAGVVPQQSITLPPELLQREALVQGLSLHPELQQYRFKLDALQVEKRLKAQSLLPSVYLKYNQLNKSHDLTKSFSTPWLQNNYRYGVNVAVPLRLSEGRGEYRKAKLKIEQTLLQQAAKQVSLQAKLQASYNEWKALREQIALQQAALQSYVALQRGEEIKFGNGESSLFLVNAREQKTLEARQKLIELQSKEQKAAAGTLWAAGMWAGR